MGVGIKNETWKLHCPCTKYHSIQSSPPGAQKETGALKSDDSAAGVDDRFVSVQKDSSGVWWFAHRGQHFLSKGVNHVNNGGQDDGVGGRESPACKAGVTRGAAKIPGSPLCGDTLSYSPLIGYAPYFNSTQERYGSEEKWASVTATRLESWNFNTLGGWSATVAEKAAAARGLYYAHLLDLGTTWLSHTGLDHDVFNASFAAQCQAAVAKQVAPRANDEQLLGWQLDNELNWHGLGLSSFLGGYHNLDGSISNAGKQVAVNFVRDQCAGKADEVCNDNWLGVVAEKYFAETVGAIRSVDSNHLILGMRGGVFCGDTNCSSIQAILKATAKWIDVFDYHDYSDDPPFEILQTVHAVTGLPIILGEWSFTAFDSNMPNTGGSRSCRDPVAAAGQFSAGLDGEPCLPGRGPGTHCPAFIPQSKCQSVRTTQSQRASDYTRFVTELVKLPFAIGFHWWQWADEPSQGRWPDGECSNYGLVHISDDVYGVITEAMSSTNAKLDAVHNRSRVDGDAVASKLQGKTDDDDILQSDDNDLAWVEQPQAWHQQAIRIVDHPFTTLVELREFGLQARKAGVSVVELVGVQKTKSCPGVWCGGLGLCDHINGSFPADDPTATLADWRQMLKDIKPVRLMWWLNVAYWSTQGEVSQQAMADPTSDVGRFFSYGPNASAFPVCPGKWLGNASDPKQHSFGYSNPCFKDPKTGKQLCAQGSWGSVSGNCNRSGYPNTSACFNDKLDGCSKAVMEQSDTGRCIPSLNANLAHREYVDYLADALANSWSRNLGIDGFILDTSVQVPCSPGINPKYGEPGGSEYIFYNDIIGRVRETQPQVVLSGEDCSDWDDAIAHNFQLPGTKSAGPMLAMRAAAEAKDLDTIEDAVASSGADAATVICYLHPGLDGKPSGACPTLYYRDTLAAYSKENVSTYQLWVALEAASGILSEHQHSPTAVFGQGFGSWNVTADPHDEDNGTESPLWAFSRSRALNRLALRTKLKVSTSTQSDEGRSDPLAAYTEYADSNCYHTPHGGVVLPRTGAWLNNQTAASCVALCTADEKCDCVTYQARQGAASQSKLQYKCWPRANCEPGKFEHDNLTHCYDVYVKKTAPPPLPPAPSPPSAAGGAIAYLKHDALGPHGDAAIVVFNPGVAKSLTVDLSLLPPALLASRVVPVDLFTNASASTPLAANWTVAMGAGSFAAFGFRGLGVFAPRKGKFQECTASDGYSKPSAATTLQSCFFECKRDTRCKNVFVDMKALPRWLEKPGPVACTLLGAVASTKIACAETGSGTLVKMLDARPQS